MDASIFRNFNEVVEDLSVQAILDQIKSGLYKQQIENLRQLLRTGKEQQYSQQKKSLPAFTPSATFKGGRKLEYLNAYSGLIILDLDKIPDESLDEIKTKAISCPFTFACFISPGGNGLKILVKADSSLQIHNQAFNNIKIYYESELSCIVDPSGKDVTRLCFYSYDPELYLNNDSATFRVNPTHQPINLPQTPDYSAIFKKCLNFTERKSQYFPGNRNNHIYLLSSNCNRNGIPELETLKLVSDYFDLGYKEISAVVKSAYTHHQSEYAKMVQNCDVAGNSMLDTSPSVPENEEIDYLKSSPTIPSNVYANLPDILKNGAAALNDLREKDVFLTGSISILSGCLPGVIGVYAQQTVYPNLFSFIVAPAASGKGAMKFSKTLADVYHESTLHRSRQLAKLFKASESNYKARMRMKTDQDDYEDPPEKPPFKVIFIPANSSYAKLLLHLQQNDGEGIICEAEADTMGNVLKHDWGNYSDMLRKVFHHDRISSSKKSNDEFIEVDNPRLSIAISGTPNQVTGLISSSEDGLFSRFLFYIFKSELFWRDVSPFNGNINLTDHFKNLSSEVFKLVEFLQESPTEVLLSRMQWNELNALGARWLQEISLFNGEDTSSIIKRLGLILYRICMLLTALRKFENGELAQQVECTDTDFDTAKLLSEVYLQHSLLMYHNLPKNESGSKFYAGDRKKIFLDSLPSEFKRKDAIEIGKQFKLSPRTVDNILNSLTGSYLNQISYGIYMKVKI